MANLSPVSLAGTTVKRATLHNADQIEKLDLHENDTVFIEKGGEIEGALSQGAEPPSAPATPNTPATPAKP